MSFYPPNQPVPARLRTDEFVLRPLTTAHVNLDYAALMVSTEMLRLWSGTSWPTDDFTLEENWEDLAMHDREHQERVAFTYTVLTPDEMECLGCVYITPLTNSVALNPQVLTDIAPDTAVVGFWVKQPRLADHLDERLLAVLRDWLAREWLFSAVYFSARDVNKQQIQLLEAASMKKQYTISVSRRANQFFLYKA
jgi:RimJ/RimL family protein N-acetyltransferase